jgi:hypothetical protein
VIKNNDLAKKELEKKGTVKKVEKKRKEKGLEQKDVKRGFGKNLKKKRNLNLIKK